MTEPLDYLKKYLQYVRNTGNRPLAIIHFDDDWEPIGPTVRSDLMRYGLIEQHAGGLMLTVEAEAMLDD